MDASKLEQLGQLTAETDAAGPPTPEQQAEQQAAEAADQQAREWGMVAYAIGSALSMLAPELRQVYTEDACLAWGGAMVPVAEKYGWSGPSNVPEIGLLIATGTLAVPSYIVIKAKLQAIREARERAGKEGEAHNAAATAAGVTDGGES